MRTLPASDSFATRVYVIGEVLISLAALGGGAAMVFYGADDAVQLVGSGMVSGVIGVWFARRQGEQSNNALSQLANGKLSQVLEQTLEQQKRTEQLALMVARSQPREGA